MRAFIKGIASYLPENIELNAPESRLTKKTGIYERHIVNNNECSSDLAVKAAENLFAHYNFDKNKIDFIILCTQSPDYFLPTTACLLQHRIGLSNRCGAFDFNLGCSGYIYGLSIVKGLIESGQAQNVLLVTAETYSKWIHPEDGTVRPLFGDAATATLVCREDTDCEGLGAFQFGTDGSRGENLIVPAGGTRNPINCTPILDQIDEYGNKRTNHNLYMNGKAISEFALDVVPATVEAILNHMGYDRNAIDYYVFHQANKFMLDFLQQKCGLQGLPYWNKPDKYGNTVSSTIPLALQEISRVEQTSKLKKVMAIGFGVGLSWAGCLLDLSKMYQVENKE
ncbi:MAG: ketoacyl-ACP synthase III [Firmicutes bacterium]|nr:ketoacyl-ACP synthase III [Bacillota bacterium]